MEMILRTLGGLELEGSSFRRPKPLLLLAYLAMEGPQLKRHLADLFWPQGQRMKSLSMTLTRLRKGAAGIVESNERKVWTKVETDARQVLDALKRGDGPSVLNLYRGPFLEGVYLPDWSVELEEWLYANREHLAARVRSVMIGRAEAEAAGGRFEFAAERAEEAYRLGAAPPLEPDELSRLQALAVAGNSPLATAIGTEVESLGIVTSLSSDDARRRLKDALATAESPTPHNLPVRTSSSIGRERELDEAAALLSMPEVRLLTLTGPAGVGKTHLGLELALRGLETRQFPDGVYFVSLAPLRDADLVASSIAQTLGVAENPTRPVVDNLAAHLRGRKVLLVLDNFEQVAAAATSVAELLSSCENIKILATSRVALQLSMGHEFPVSPLPLPDIRQLPPPEALLRNPAVALFIQRAKAVKPDFSVNPLNARSVAEICIRLDGLPLALELAAARTKLFSPRAMLQRLDKRLELLKGGARDKPARHQTLRQAIAWSYELLSKEEKALFRQTAVFVGGFTLAAADYTVRASNLAPFDTLDGVTALINKSLLRSREDVAGETRFSMLETIREYGLECLKHAGEFEATMRAQTAFLLELAERAEPELTGPEQGLWLGRLAAEHDNFRAALLWAPKHDTESAVRLEASLWRYWVIRGHMREGREQLEMLLAEPRAQSRSRMRAKALNGLGTIIHEIADFAAARPYLKESLAIYRETGDREGVATVVTNLGWVAFGLSDFAEATSLSKEALALNRAQGHKRGMALSLNNLGWIETHRGNMAAAHPFFQEGLRLRRELHDERGVAFALINLAWVERCRTCYEAAEILLEEALGILDRLDDKQLIAWALYQQGCTAFDSGWGGRPLLERSAALWREVGSRDGLAMALEALADAACEGGEYDLTAGLLEEAVSIWQTTGSRWGIACGLWRWGSLFLAQSNLQMAEERFMKSLHLRTSLGDSRGMAECLESLAVVNMRQDDLRRAVRLCSAADRLRERIDAPQPKRLHKEHEQLVKTLRARLGEEVFEAAWLEYVSGMPSLKAMDEAVKRGKPLRLDEVVGEI